MHHSFGVSIVFRGHIYRRGHIYKTHYIDIETRLHKDIHRTHSIPQLCRVSMVFRGHEHREHILWCLEDPYIENKFYIDIENTLHIDIENKFYIH